MENLNSIPKSGSYGSGVDLHNDNYQKIGVELQTLRELGQNDKGYFETLSALQSKYPTPQSGWQAYIKDAGSSTGYYVANVNSSGNWVVTAAEAPPINVDLAGYAKTGGSTKTVKEVEDEIVQLESDVSVKLENLVVNGDFRDGNNLWETNSANLTGSGKFVATAKDGLIRRSSGNRISYKAGDKIYMAANFKADTPLAWFNSNLGAGTGYFHSGSGLFERQSIIYTAPDDSTGNSFLIRIGDGRNSGWTEIEVAYMYALNFTEIFGVGNEPTIEEFESLLNLIGTEYFEGTYNIPSQLVMQWVLGQIKSDYPMLLALDYNLNGTPVYENYTIKSCNIKWVNGMTGILTFSDFDEAESAFTSFIATCPDLGMRVRQPKVIFDGNGQITNYPSLIVETI